MKIFIDPNNVSESDVDRIVAALENDGVIAYPTDTVYGLGADIFNKKAVEKILRIKGRDKKKPMSILCSDLSQVAQYAQVSNQAFKVLKEALPGPYTFILPANRKTPHTVIAKNKTVGVRIPESKLAIKVVEKLGVPIVTTSLNVSGEPVVTHPDQLPKEQYNQIDLIIDAGELSQDASTVIDLTGPVPTIIREGKGDTSIFGA